MSKEIMISSDLATDGIWRALVVSVDQTKRQCRVYIPQLHRKNNPFASIDDPHAGVDFTGTNTKETDFPIAQISAWGSFNPPLVGDAVSVMFECGNVEYPVILGSLRSALPLGDVMVSVFGTSLSDYTAGANVAYEMTGNYTLTGLSSTASEIAKKALQAGASQIGTPYVWGAESPGRGFDCSHFVHWCFQTAGYAYGYRTAANLASFGTAVPSWSYALSGDIVVCRGGKHVVLVVDPVSKQIMHASSSKGICVATWSFENSGWYKIRRLI